MLYLRVIVKCDKIGCGHRTECDAEATADVKRVPEAAAVHFHPVLKDGWVWTRSEGFLCPDHSPKEC